MKSKIVWPLGGFLFGWFILCPVLFPNNKADEQWTDTKTTNRVSITVTNGLSVYGKSDYERGIEDAITTLSLVNLERAMIGTNWSFLQMSNIVKARLLKSHSADAAPQSSKGE